MKKLGIAIVVALIFSCAVGYAQNVASNKAFFAKSTNEVILAPFNGAAVGPEVVLFDAPATIKTSTNGAISATLSMEAALWTYNITTAIVNGGKASSSSRAAIKARILIDDVPMLPDWVVYADRLQATGLTVNLACAVPLTTCTVTGNVTLELFQATKNANSFTFFLGPLGTSVHNVKVIAQGFIECHDSVGTVIPCPNGTLAGYNNASTMAAIGKATLMLEEQQLWGSDTVIR